MNYAQDNIYVDMKNYGMVDKLIKEKVYLEVGYIQELLDDGHITEAKSRVESLRNMIHNEL